MKDEKQIEYINKTGDFIHKAFCVDGSVKFVKMTDPSPGFNCDGMLFELEDSKRGLFYVGIYKPKD